MLHEWNIGVLFLRKSTSAPTRSHLRWEFATMAAGVALFAVALVAIVNFFFRRRTRDLTLVYFGVFCILYATRLLAHVSFVRALFNEPGKFWDYLTWLITCTIILPCSLFVYQVVGEHIRKLIRWLLAAQTAFAVFGIAAAALGASLIKLNEANSVVVLGTFVATGVFLAARTRRSGPRTPLSCDVRVFLGRFLVWRLFIVEANLSGLGIVHWRDVEFLGFLFFVASLRYVAARRTCGSEERLAAIKSELEIARRIQFSTLPQSNPTLAGLEIAARYVPMSAVAGDFYDFLVVDARRVGILIADVTGHGVPAALIASMLKVAFAGQVSHAHDPAAVIGGLNRSLLGKFEEHFITAAYLFVDLERGVLRYSAAGHPPLMLVSRAGGPAREIEENGLMLGMFPEAVYSSVEIPIGEEDRGLLYTDGVLEARDAADEEFGKRRCKEFLQSHAKLAAPAFADTLLANIAAFSGQNPTRPPEDDITLLVLDFQSGRA